MSQHCLITGCALYVPAENKALWGDLHVFNDQYIFNGVLDKNGQAQWNHLQIPMTAADIAAASTRTLTLREGVDYFEKRGVVVVPQVGAELNPAAKSYLDQGVQR